MLPITPLLNGFLLGLSTGPVCMISCVPLILPFTLGRGGGSLWPFVGKFLGGRLVAYSLVGILAGLLGSALPPSFRRVGIVLWILLSLLLVMHGTGWGFKHLGFCRAGYRFMNHRHFPAILGFMAGISVCPPFLLAVAYAMERGTQVAGGLAFFLAFFAATTLYVLPLGFLGHLPRSRWLGHIGKVAAVGAGLFMLYQGLAALRISSIQTSLP
ncbi:MAG: sulfite exporter TauE/SafE family protein [Acidobacteria bacterium]|nr:sulfite exporter TauE/SafE family protein [Acidobacteriota bacterium]MBI3489387.1 sulfite exporter TauE/SafE family protein [Acidobacteriota bacterium]